MNSSRPPSLQITVTGFGDVGQAYVAALVQQGLIPRIYHPAPRERAIAAARALGLAICSDPVVAYRDCELVLQVAPGAQALSVAQVAAPLLPKAALFVDLSSASPSALREAAALFPTGRFVDVAILGAVSIHGHRTPLLASGAGAVACRDLLTPLGFPVDVLADSTAGDATALKLVRSVLTKGMDAVILECLLVAEALGMREQLLGRLGDLDRSTLTELMAMFVRTHAPHAQRRMQEMEAVEDTLKDLGVPLIVTPAVKARYARSVQMLGPEAEIPSTPEGASLYDSVLPWMLAAERRMPLDPTPDTP